MSFIQLINSSVRLKLGFSVGIIVFVALSVATAYFAINTYQDNMQNADNKVKMVAQGVSSQISRKIDQTTAIMLNHADYLKLLKKNGGGYTYVDEEFFTQ